MILAQLLSSSNLFIHDSRLEDFLLPSRILDFVMPVPLDVLSGNVREGECSSVGPEGLKHWGSRRICSKQAHWIISN